MDKSVGAVTYALALDEAGGVRSDVTVARLVRATCSRSAPTATWTSTTSVGRRPADGSVHGPRHHRRHLLHRTVGPAGPRCGPGAQPDDFTNEGFKYFRAKQVRIGGVPVTAMRLSYVGELGWELYTSADNGLRLWDVLWAEGQQHGVIAAGRAAFNSLRMEKGYRSWGTDMTTEYNPYEAGLGFAVRPAEGVDSSAATRSTGVTDDTVQPAAGLPDRRRRQSVVLGPEPVFVDGQPAGYVTSAAFGHTVGEPIAYAWLPATATRRHAGRDPVLRSPRRGHRRRGATGRPRDEEDPVMTAGQRGPDRHDRRLPRRTRREGPRTRRRRPGGTAPRPGRRAGRDGRPVHHRARGTPSTRPWSPTICEAADRLRDKALQLIDDDMAAFGGVIAPTSCRNPLREKESQVRRDRSSRLAVQPPRYPRTWSGRLARSIALAEELLPMATPM